MKRFETHPVLAAGHYRPRADGGLTHAVEVDAHGAWVRVLCERVRLDHICDVETPARLTCSFCARELRLRCDACGVARAFCDHARCCAGCTHDRPRRRVPRLLDR